MKVLHSWLREYIRGLDEDEVGANPDAVGDVMSAIGLCCEEVIHVGRGLEGIIVAKVLTLAPHPGADRIQLVNVDVGDGEALQICCGAFNMAVGDLVPLATLGTTMPDGMEIAKRKLRGEWSNGMLCSGRELGLGDDHSGILILDPTLALGTPIREALSIEVDAVYDLDLTPNRPDALSVIGVARDVAAALGLAFELPEIVVPTEGTPAGEMAQVVIEDPQLCGRFAATVLSNVPRGDSPLWMQQRLTLCGMRPINAVVDVSNYVMLEYGQPNHTYDLAKVKGAQLRVRMAHEGETIVTLDGQTRTLTARDGVIADGDDAAVGIAGVMGGASTEIGEDTAAVLLEAAWWDPGTIAFTSKRLGLRSEASARFERGVDTQIADVAALRIAQLLVAQGASLHPGVVVAEGSLPQPAVVTVRPERVSALLGTEFSAAQIAELLAPIGFAAVPAEPGGSASAGALTVSVPSWRPDSTGEIDVVEEVARRFGYNNLGMTVPSSPRAGGLTARQSDIRKLRALLVAAGCAEITPMPFLAPGDLERCGVRADGVRVANPLVAEESILRTSLLPGAVKTLGYNAAHRATGLRLFEIGHCFAQSPTDSPIPLEWEEVAVVLGGYEAAEAVRFVRGLCEAFRVEDVSIRTMPVGGLHPGRSAGVFAGEICIGVVGEIHPDVMEAYGSVERAAYFSCVLGGPEPWHGGEGLLSVERAPEAYQPFSRMPSSDVDFAFVVSDAVAPEALAATIRSASPLVRSADLFDVYRGAGVEQGSRSLAYRVRLQDADRTLTEAEISTAREAVLAAAATTHAATLR